MAGNRKFCRKCGTETDSGAKFCRVCGYQFGTEGRPGSAQVPPEQSIPEAVTCPECGNRINPGAKFCRVCGHRLEEEEWTKPAVKQQKPNQRPDVLSFPAAADVEAVPEFKKEVVQVQQLSAASRPGDFSLGDFFQEEFHEEGDRPAGGAAGAGSSSVSGAEEILSPAGAFLGGVKAFFKGITGIFQNRKTLFLTAALAMIWTVLGIFRDSGAAPVKFLSWLSFAEGGLDRSPVGALGGIAGKGAVAAVFASLFSGGAENALKGIAVLFKGKGEKRSLIYILLGLAAGAALYFVFAGFRTASSGTAMAGIAGVLLSLQALGGRTG